MYTLHAVRRIQLGPCDLRFTFAGLSRIVRLCACTPTTSTRRVCVVGVVVLVVGVVSSALFGSSLPGLNVGLPLQTFCANRIVLMLSLDSCSCSDGMVLSLSGYLHTKYQLPFTTSSGQVFILEVDEFPARNLCWAPISILETEFRVSPAAGGLAALLI